MSSGGPVVYSVNTIRYKLYGGTLQTEPVRMSAFLYTYKGQFVGSLCLIEIDSTSSCKNLRSVFPCHREIEVYLA